jgi:outer membrane protein Omp28/type IX secretion system substrate protein
MRPITTSVLTVFLILCIASTNLLAQSGQRRILFEEFSTVPCGFCPDGAIIARQIVDAHPSVIWVTHHAGFGTDSMTVPESVVIAKDFTNFAPGAIIDRGVFPKHVSPNFPYIATTRSKWDSVVTAHINDPVTATVDITNSYDPSSRMLQCTVDVSFIEDPTGDDIRVNIFLVEDNVTGVGSGYDQRNYYNATQGHPMYGRGENIVGYSHERVVRSIPTGAWGQDGIIPSEPETGTKYSHTFTNIPISGMWKDGDLDVVAFVSLADSRPHYRQVINSNALALTESTTGIDDLEGMSIASGISVHPNPATDRVVFTFGQSSAPQSVLVISDISGRTVAKYALESSLKRFVLPVHKLRKGLYFYRIHDAKGHLEGGKFLIFR